MAESPQNDFPPPPPGWREEVLKKLELQQRRVKFVRILAIVFAFITVGGTIALSIFGGSGMAPNAMRFAKSPDGQTYVAQNEHSWMGSVWHKIGKVEGQEIEWGGQRSGELSDMEFGPEGAVAYFEKHAQLFQEHEMLVNGEAKGERQIYAPNAPRFPARCIAQGGIASAWVSNSRLFASLGGTTEIKPIDLELEVGTSTFSALFDIGGGRLQLLVMCPEEGDSDTKTFRLFAISFAIEKYLPPVTETVSDDEEGEEEAIEGDENSEKEASEAPEEDLGSDQAPEIQAQSEEHFFAKDIKALQLAAGVVMFYPVEHEGKITCFFKSQGASGYQFLQGIESEWTEAQDADESINTILSTLRTEEANFLGPNRVTYRRPHLYGMPNGGLRHYQINVDEASVAVMESASVESPSFTEAKSFTNSSQRFILPYGFFYVMMISSMVGLIGTMVWLSLNRPHQVETVIRNLVAEKTGRDTSKVHAPVGAPMDMLIPWAGLIRRALGFGIDFLVVMPVVWILAEQVGRDPSVALNIFPSEQKSLVDGVMERLMALFVFGLYGFVCEYLWGRTLGKRILGMRVVTAKGQAPGMMTLFFRNMLRAIELAHSLLVVGAMFSIIFTRKHQRLGDLLSGSAVRIEMPSDDDGALQEPSDL